MIKPRENVHEGDLSPFFHPAMGLKTINGRRSTAFLALSRNFDLNGEAGPAKAKQNNPIILPA